MCFPVSGCLHFWWLPEEPTHRKPCWRRILIAWSEVSLGVPRSPNRDLEELRIFGQIDISRRQVKFYGLSDIRAGLGLGQAGGGTARQFGTHCRVVAGLGIMFQDDPECHTSSIVRR